MYIHTLQWLIAVWADKSFMFKLLGTQKPLAACKMNLDGACIKTKKDLLDFN